MIDEFSNVYRFKFCVVFFPLRFFESVEYGFYFHFNMIYNWVTETDGPAIHFFPKWRKSNGLMCNLDMIDRQSLIEVGH